MDELNLNVRESQVESTLIPIGGKLPYKLELRTDKILDLLLYFYGKKLNISNPRKKLNIWLYSKTRPGFYVEFTKQFHLAYADQRDGHGTKHYWRIFFTESLKQRIESIVNQTALTIQSQESTTENQTRANPFSGMKEWGGMYFRSESEIQIAKALEKAQLLYFANIRGRISGNGLPISNSQMTGRLEIDFLIFKNGKALGLEVDGNHHTEQEQIKRDYVKDRLLLNEGIPVVRFTASECYNKPDFVIEEILSIIT